MSTVFIPFPDSETALKGLLESWFPDQLTDGHIGTEEVQDVRARLPYVRLERIGGQRFRLNDYPVLDVEVYHSTREGARSLSEAIDAKILGYPYSVDVATRLVTIDAVQVNASPREIPWEDSNIRRFASTYQFSVRR